MTRRTAVAILAAMTLLIGMTVSPALAARPVFVFTTQLTGEAEVPGPGDPDARGHATIAVIPGTHTICWNVTWNRVDGTVFAAHIHGPAPADDFTGVVVPLFVDQEFGSIGRHRGCTVSEAWADEIVATPELFYVNVHSSPNFPGGAIRGQLA